MSSKPARANGRVFASVCQVVFVAKSKWEGWFLALMKVYDLLRVTFDFGKILNHL